MTVHLKFFAEDARYRYRVVGEEQDGWWLVSVKGPAGSAFFVAAESKHAYQVLD